ncbi:MAG: hypothetical protein ACP5L4_06765 [Thermoplasmata archaeon]
MMTGLMNSGIFAFSQNLFKEEKSKKYQIKVSIILEYGDTVEDFKDFEIQIDSWDILFYDHMVKLNEEEIEKFKNSKKFERRV